LFHKQPDFITSGRHFLFNLILLICLWRLRNHNIAAEIPTSKQPLKPHYLLPIKFIKFFFCYNIICFSRSQLPRQDPLEELTCCAEKASPCPSQLSILSEIIDKFACACQSWNHDKTLGNFVLFVWSKFKITWNLAAENLVLRQQLVVMKRTNRRSKIQMTDRLFWVLLSRIWSPWRRSLVIVKPDTVIRWHRKGFKLFSKNDSPENKNEGFTHCVLMTFIGEEGRKYYLPHPEHSALKGIFLPVLDDLIILDYSL
jgi:hypothetical protein